MNDAERMAQITTHSFFVKTSVTITAASRQAATAQVTNALESLGVLNSIEVKPTFGINGSDSFATGINIDLTSHSHMSPLRILQSRRDAVRNHLGSRQLEYAAAGEVVVKTQAELEELETTIKFLEANLAEEDEDLPTLNVF
jgi:hypothetical protein